MQDCYPKLLSFPPRTLNPIQGGALCTEVSVVEAWPDRVLPRPCASTVRTSPSSQNNDSRPHPYVHHRKEDDSGSLKRGATLVGVGGRLAALPMDSRPAFEVPLYPFHSLLEICEVRVTDKGERRFWLRTDTQQLRGLAHRAGGCKARTLIAAAGVPRHLACSSTLGCCLFHVLRRAP